MSEQPKSPAEIVAWAKQRADEGHAIGWEPWQRELLDKLMASDADVVLDIPHRSGRSALYEVAEAVRDDVWWEEKHALLCGNPECRGWEHHQQRKGPYPRP